MKFDEYDFRRLEPQIRNFWKSQDIKRKSQERDGKPFYFLDGPPYTSGRVHIGHAWNKSMKDVVVRMRTMQNRRVFTRAGYDMHGLPNEHAAMKELDLHTKEDILAFGLDRFVEACKSGALEKLRAMNEDFERLGVWLDFDDAYQTMSEEWIESVWWLVKQAYTKGRLYEGLRPMAWDPVHESALAKHELYYKQVEDTSIYVKFRKRDSNEYFIVWTTTPWTIPYNLMIMVHPEIAYAKVLVEDEIWIIAESRVEDVLSAAQTTGEVQEVVSGASLAGSAYEHFFSKELGLDALKHQHPAVHTVVLSDQYVTDDSGSGLVHAAPGCGPEDYEVGVQHDVPAYNTLDEQGRFPQDAGVFSGKQARTDDEYFIALIHEQGALVAQEAYLHDYPHAERSKAPIVFKATKQWFFRIADRKEELLEANNHVTWNPKAGYNAFASWLENLRDNSITKQRFWGTPLPIWRNTQDPEDIIVVGSREELHALGAATPQDLHKPWIDEVIIHKDGKEYARIPDVIDVWVDAGVASFAALRYPQQQELLNTYFPADFIIEGNDQIRGWFNLLMVTGMLGFDKAPFTHVYMHGMINDSSGRKMSKSIGNYITPEEVITQFGTDACRLYWVGGARAGLDLNYNLEDCRQKHRNLNIYFNIHKYILELAAQTPVKPLPEELRFEDRYILSVTQRALNTAAALMEGYEIDKLPGVVEHALQELSRTYIQLVRQRTDAENVLAVLAYSLKHLIALLAPICPFITEAMWQNLKEPLALNEESVHMTTLATDSEHISDVREEEMKRAQELITLILSARDSAQIGVRWPLKEVITNVKPLSEQAAALVQAHTNVRALTFAAPTVSCTLEPNYKALGKRFGQDTPTIAKVIAEHAEEYLKQGSIIINGEELSEDYYTVTYTSPEGYSLAQNQEDIALLDIQQTPELLSEGFFREIVRRTQHLRKTADMNKQDAIRITLAPDLKEYVEVREEEYMRVVGAVSVSYADPSTMPHYETYRVRDKELALGIALH